MLVYFLLMCIVIILCRTFYLKTRVSYNNKLYLYYKGMYNDCLEENKNYYDKNYISQEKIRSINVQLEECSKVIEAKNKYEDDLLNANLSWEEKYTELIKTCDCLDNDIKQEKINSSILTEKLEASGFQIDDLKREKESLIKEIENLKTDICCFEDETSKYKKELKEYKILEDELNDKLYELSEDLKNERARITQFEYLVDKLNTEKKGIRDKLELEAKKLLAKISSEIRCYLEE